MQRKAIWASIVVVLLGALAIAQAQESYLDVYTVQVKPEKRADFDAISKKIAAANRQNGGDSWLAIETVYGPGNRVSFISTRTSYGDIEKATGAFYEALQKTFGKNTEKTLQDFSQCLQSSRSEIRRRRWDLSSNVPSDPAALSKLIAGSRWLRTTAVHVRPGQNNRFEEILKELKAARDKASPPQIMLVSQDVNGILLPVILIFILILAHREDVMGKWRTGSVYNAIGWATAIALIGLTVLLVGASVRDLLRA